MCSTPPPGPGVLGFLDLVEKALDDYGGAALFGLSDPELNTALGRVKRIAARLSAMDVALVREADGRGLAARVGASGIAAVLRGEHRMAPARAKEQVQVATALDGELAATGAALAAGRISYEHATVIVKVVGGLHADVPAELRAAAQDKLLEAAGWADPATVRLVGRHLQSVLNPDPDEDDTQRRARRTLSMRERLDGMTELRGLLDPEGAAIVAAALDPLAKPTPHADGIPDPRSPGQRRADALIEACKHLLDTGALPTTGGVRPHIAVTVPYNTLVGLGHQPGATEHGHLPLPKSVIDRLCCDASLRRIVFGPASEPLDVGRAARTVTPAIRAAVVARDGVCTFPGCDRPPAWSDVHHIDYWNHGGVTSVANSALICGRHHELPHHENWQLRIGPEGRVEWQAPEWIDPDHTWRTNPIRQARDPYLLPEETAQPP